MYRPDESPIVIDLTISTSDGEPSGLNRIPDCGIWYGGVSFEMLTRESIFRTLHVRNNHTTVRHLYDKEAYDKQERPKWLSARETLKQRAWGDEIDHIYKKLDSLFNPNFSR